MYIKICLANVNKKKGVYGRKCLLTASYLGGESLLRVAALTGGGLSASDFACQQLDGVQYPRFIAGLLQPVG